MLYRCRSNWYLLPTSQQRLNLYHVGDGFLHKLLAGRPQLLLACDLKLFDRATLPPIFYKLLLLGRVLLLIQVGIALLFMRSAP
jgi:hypothetical protein